MSSAAEMSLDAPAGLQRMVRRHGHARPTLPRRLTNVVQASAHVISIKLPPAVPTTEQIGLSAARGS